MLNITMLTTRNNFGQCPWDREKHTFLKIIEAGTTSGNENAWTTMAKKKKKNERRWMQRIRHDEKQWANQTHGCFSVSVLLAGKKKRNSTSGKCVFADWQQQRQFPFIPNSIIFPYTHTHCLKAVGQCWWWWWSLKSGNDDDAPVVAFSETLSHYYLPEIRPLYILRWTTAKSSLFSILSPFYH